jgi:hypothetical protein
MEIMKKTESKLRTIGNEKANVALTGVGLEAEIDALQNRQQDNLILLAFLLAVVLFSSFLAMVMNFISLEVCKLIGFAATGVFFTAVHICRQKVARLQVALKGQAVSPIISKLDLIRRCETFDREMSAGTTPSVNPYPLLYDDIHLPEERLRELNHEILKCLRSFDQTNLYEIQQILTSRRSKADIVLLVSFLILISSAFAFTRTLFLGFDSIPNLLVMGLGSIAFITIVGTTLVRLMDNQNLSCLELWISEIAKNEPKPKLNDSLFD